MPPKIVNDLCERVARLEERVADVKLWIKVIFGMNTAIIVGVVINILRMH